MSLEAELRVTLADTTFSVPLHVEGVDPEAVFVAANRISELRGDLQRLPLEWQKAVRVALDENKATSMTAGDSYRIVVGDCDLGGMRCKPQGWERL